jgi:sugar phosphate isomerase/epimerase
MKIKQLVLVCLLAVPFFVQAQKLYTYPIGVQAYTFRNHFPKDVAKTLDLIQSMGITEIEGSAQQGQTPEQFKQMCADRGISVPSTGVDFNDLANPADAIAKAKVLGAKFVMCAWIPHKVRGGFTLEEAEKAVAVFNEAGKKFRENGLTLCYHDHGYEFQPFGKKETLLDYIIQNTNPEYVSFEMDVLWTMHGGGADMPEKLLKKYPTRFKLMHVKDLRKGVAGDLTGGTPAENDVPVGTGQGNWKAIIKLAKKNGIEHCFIEDESNQEVQFVPLSIAYLKSL